MNKKVLFFLCTTMFLCYASEHSFEVDLFTVQNKRRSQEDRYINRNFFQEGSLFGLFDGHAGSEVAEYAAQNLPEKFAVCLSCSSSVQKAFELTFLDIEEYACNHYKWGGSTAICVYIKDRIAHIANIGDSRVAIGNKNGVVFATQDHTVKRDDERERVIKANGRIYREANETGSFVGPWRIDLLMMSRSLGDLWPKGREVNAKKKYLPSIRIMRDSKGVTPLFLEEWPGDFLVHGLEIEPQVGQVIAEPEYMQEPLTAAHNYLVIATDGLWDKVSNEEAIATVDDYCRQKGSLTGIAAFLCECAMTRGSTDNITVLVVDLLSKNKS